MRHLFVVSFKGVDFGISRSSAKTDVGLSVLAFDTGPLNIEMSGGYAAL